MLQDALTLAVVLLAAAYIFRRVTGWPRRRPKPGAGVVVGSRLSRGLAKAAANDDRDCCK